MNNFFNRVQNYNNNVQNYNNIFNHNFNVMLNIFTNQWRMNNFNFQQQQNNNPNNVALNNNFVGNNNLNFQPSMNNNMMNNNMNGMFNCFNNNFMLNNLNIMNNQLYKPFNNFTPKVSNWNNNFNNAMSNLSNDIIQNNKNLNCTIEYDIPTSLYKFIENLIDGKIEKTFTTNTGVTNEDIQSYIRTLLNSEKEAINRTRGIRNNTDKVMAAIIWQPLGGSNIPKELFAISKENYENFLKTGELNISNNPKELSMKITLNKKNGLTFSIDCPKVKKSNIIKNYNRATKEERKKILEYDQEAGYIDFEQQKLHKKIQFENNERQIQKKNIEFKNNELYINGVKSRDSTLKEIYEERLNNDFLKLPLKDVSDNYNRFNERIDNVNRIFEQISNDSSLDSDEYITEFKKLIGGNKNSDDDLIIKIALQQASSEINPLNKIVSVLKSVNELCKSSKNIQDENIKFLFALSNHIIDNMIKIKNNSSIHDKLQCLKMITNIFIPHLANTIAFRKNINNFNKLNEDANEILNIGKQIEKKYNLQKKFDSIAKKINTKNSNMLKKALNNIDIKADFVEQQSFDKLIEDDKNKLRMHLMKELVDKKLSTQEFNKSAKIVDVKVDLFVFLANIARAREKKGNDLSSNPEICEMHFTCAIESYIMLMNYDYGDIMDFLDNLGIFHSEYDFNFQKVRKQQENQKAKGIRKKKFGFKCLNGLDKISNYALAAAEIVKFYREEEEYILRGMDRKKVELITRNGNRTFKVNGNGIYRQLFPPIKKPMINYNNFPY